jgi:hypothetical protein
MRSNDKLLEIGWEILDKMYEVAVPPLDFRKFRNGVEDGNKKCPRDWFMKHTITEELYNEIIDGSKKKYQITDIEFRKLAWLLLDYSPKFLDTRM